MKSIREIYKIGKGPSSSHTMGPQAASEVYLKHHPQARGFHVRLYGSLAATGRGHLTDVAIKDVLSPAGKVYIELLPKVYLPKHPNAMSIAAVANPDAIPEEGSVDETQLQLSDEWTFYSVGGGTILCDQLPEVESPEIYSLNTMTELLQWCNSNGKAYWEYVQQVEGTGIYDYLQTVWEAMQASIERGLDQEGVLPGPLHLRRKAASYYIRSEGYKDVLRTRGLIFAYALAVSEENASGAP